MLLHKAKLLGEVTKHKEQIKSNSIFSRESLACATSCISDKDPIVRIRAVALATTLVEIDSTPPHALIETFSPKVQRL